MSPDARREASGVVVVVRATAQEWRTVREVRLRALSTNPDAFGSTLAREQVLDDEFWRDRAAAGRTFLARAGELVVGIASYYVEEGRDDERQLVSMWVTPAGRRAGVGAMLVDAVQDAARDEGAAALTLFVADGNAGARRFYESLGFRSTGERENLGRGPASDAERYVLALE